MVHINKWAVLPAMAIVGAIGYGIYEIFSPTPLFQATNPKLVFLNSLEESKEIVEDIKQEIEENASVEKEEEVVIEKEEEVLVEDTPDVSSVSIEAKAKLEEDDKFVKNLWGDSIGWMWRDYLILAPTDDPVWVDKAEKINKWLASGSITANGWPEMKKGEVLEGEKVAELCRTAVSRLHWATLLTGRRKDFWDITWDFCGRPNTPKPRDWWWA